MITISRTVTAEIELHGKDVAEFFCRLDSREQAEFFNEIANFVKGWDGTFDMQMHNVSSEFRLQRSGRKIMRTIGEYSEKFTP